VNTRGQTKSRNLFRYRTPGVPGCVTIAFDDHFS
jgi:hypothetical protein